MVAWARRVGAAGIEASAVSTPASQKAVSQRLCKRLSLQHCVTQHEAAAMRTHACLGQPAYAEPASRTCITNP
jgi:hypothetical protein